MRNFILSALIAGICLVHAAPAAADSSCTGVVMIKSVHSHSSPWQVTATVTFTSADFICIGRPPFPISPEEQERKVTLKIKRSFKVKEGAKFKATMNYMQTPPEDDETGEPLETWEVTADAG